MEYILCGDRDETVALVFANVTHLLYISSLGERSFYMILLLLIGT